MSLREALKELVQKETTDIVKGSLTAYISDIYPPTKKDPNAYADVVSDPEEIGGAPLFSRAIILQSGSSMLVPAVGMECQLVFGNNSIAAPIIVSFRPRKQATRGSNSTTRFVG